MISILSWLLLVSAGKQDWQWGIREGLTLLFALALFFIELLVLAVVLYLAGLIVVGKKRALISDAFMIALLGTVLSTLFVILLPNLIAILLGVVVWLILIKRLFETGWLGAITVGILAILIYLAVLVIVALVFGILGLIIKWLTSILL
ncbi:MAG: hypothetical protein QXX79_01765 [Candidatus Bathyarchaeia archaeon]